MHMRMRTTWHAHLQEVIGPLREELTQLKLAEKLAELKEGIQGLKSEPAVASPAASSAATPAPAATPMSPASRAAAARPPPAPAPPPPPPPAFPLFPWTSALGVGGQRCAVLFYAYDGPKIAEAMLDTFEDEAAEFAACGCALVGVRKVERGDAADERKAADYAMRFPSFNFVRGLDGMTEMRRDMGWDANWMQAERDLYYNPTVALLEPDGGVRVVVALSGLSPSQVLGQVLRELHVAVPSESNVISFAESEANMQALYNDNVEWEKVLEDDETLRQPTRSWFDGVFVGKVPTNPLLAGVDNAALPAAMEQYLAEVEEGEREEDELISRDGVVAPSWYTKAKNTAERKQAAERLLWNGTAPSATAGPLPLGPEGARFAPVQGYAKAALKEASVQQKGLVQAFFRQFGDDEFNLLKGDAPPAQPDATAAAAGAGAEGGAAPTTAAAPSSGGASPPDATASALLRAEMLALGLRRSSTSGGVNTRRLRLLRELELAVGELEADGFAKTNGEAMAPLRAQLKESYAAAPPEFVDEARKDNFFNPALPRLTLAEIAKEFLELAEAGLSNRGGDGAGGVRVVDPRTLKVRRQGPREEGNKIEIKAPDQE